MRISGTHYRAIWPTATGSIRVIDQTRLPFEFATIDLETLDDAARAIRTMVVRGAPRMITKSQSIVGGQP